MLQILYLLTVVTLQSVNQGCLVEGVITRAAVHVHGHAVVLLGLIVLAAVEHAVGCTQTCIGQDIGRYTATGRCLYDSAHGSP